MKYMLIREYYDVTLGTHETEKRVVVTLFSDYQNAYDLYTNYLDNQFQKTTVLRERTLRTHEESYAVCELTNGLTASIQSISHPKVNDE